jgi:hypothetical protein
MRPGITVPQKDGPKVPNHLKLEEDFDFERVTNLLLKAQNISWENESSSHRPISLNRNKLMNFVSLSVCLSVWAPTRF